MPLTKQQAQVVAELMRDCRPAGANRWDVAGCMAALAKVADRSLGEVVRAATRLAENRDAKTPMALAQPGPQWREADQPPPRREPYDIGAVCGICERAEGQCRNNPHAGHDFVPKVEVIRRRRATTTDPAQLGGVPAFQGEPE